MDESKLAPYSCSQCRKRHRKCDRALPRCGQCIAHNGECVFEAPHKRGPRGKNVATFTYSPYGQPKPSTTASSPTPQKSTPPPGTVALPHDADVQVNMKEANMSYRYMAIEATNIYFNVRKLAYFLPLIEEQKVDSILLYVNNVHSGILDPNVGQVPCDDDLALVYSMQALVFKTCGYARFAEHFFDKSRRLLRTSFDGVLANQTTAASFSYMSSYLVSDGEFDRAEFYVKNLSDYLDLQRDRHSSNDSKAMRDRFLEVLMHSTQALMNNSEDLVLVIKTYLTAFLTLKMYDKIQSALASKPSFIILGDEFLPHYLQIKDDVVHSRDNFHLTMQFMDQISNMFLQLFDMAAARDESKTPPIEKLTYLLYSNGVKLQLLRRMGHPTLSTSDFISDMTTTQPFIYCSISVCTCISMAAEDHLRNGDPSIQRLRQDLTALNILKTKFNLVNVRYGALIRRIEQFISDFEYRQNILSSLNTRNVSSNSGNGFEQMCHVFNFLDESGTQQQRVQTPSSAPALQTPTITFEHNFM